MTEIENISVILLRTAELLRLGELTDWACAFERLDNHMAIDPNGTIDNILSLYGGMGSFNDLILYRDGKPLVCENNELDALRMHLYGLCHR